MTAPLDGTVSTAGRGLSRFPWPSFLRFTDRRRPASFDAAALLAGEADFAVIDTELTGLNHRKDSIVSVGGVRMHGGRILMSQVFDRLVAPRTELTGKSVLIHGITPSEVRSSPSIDLLLPEFLEFIGDRILVGHGVSIDLKFLNREMERIMGHPLPNPVMDTMALHGFLRKREEKACAFHEGDNGPRDLVSLAGKSGIPIADAHTALGDAFLTAQLFQRYLAALHRHGYETIGDLLRAGAP